MFRRTSCRSCSLERAGKRVPHDHLATAFVGVVLESSSMDGLSTLDSFLLFFFLRVVGKVEQFSVDGASSVREFEFHKQCDFLGFLPFD